VRTLTSIGGVFRRDLRIQLSYPVQLASQGVGIAFSLATLFFVGKLVGNSPLLAQYQGGYFEFALVGLLVVTLAGVALQAFTGGLRAETAAGTLEFLLVSRTPLWVLLAGWMAWPMTLAGVQAVVFFGVGWWLSQGSFDVGGLLAAVPPFLLTVGSFIALGIMSAAFTVMTKRGDPFTPIIVSATNLLAGALFPVAVLPTVLQVLSRAFPAFYGFNAMRSVLLGGESFLEILDELAALLAFNLALFPIGLWMLRSAFRLARITGTLATE
jgi:ABC-2 type transport system permease protein